ncbi:MAG: hypothetical protein IPL18_15055 [Sphingomonadales bacterium]|nr:hypothetical protein [Sphingomonadales bacterium]
MDLACEKRVIRLFEQALDWPPAAREARLRKALADEPDVLASVLATPKADDARRCCAPWRPNPPRWTDLDHGTPEWIGNHRITDETGRGGMGAGLVAPRAMMACLDQQVAIKWGSGETSFSPPPRNNPATERPFSPACTIRISPIMLDGGASEDREAWYQHGNDQGRADYRARLLQGLDLARGWPCSGDSLRGAE